MEQKPETKRKRQLMDKKVEVPNSILGDGETLNINDCVLIKQGPTDPEPYVGKVTRIRMDYLQTEVYVKWYYRPYETKYGYLVFQGKQEVLSSDRKSWEDRDSILRKCKVYTIDQYLRLNETDEDVFFYRSKYDYKNQKFANSPKFPQHCNKCIWPFNPDIPMIRCDNCLWW